MIREGGDKLKMEVPKKGRKEGGGEGGDGIDRWDVDTKKN
jgi:hypothetical protein